MSSTCDIEEKLIIDDNHNDSERDEKMKQVVEVNRALRQNYRE